MKQFTVDDEFAEQVLNPDGYFEGSQFNVSIPDPDPVDSELPLQQAQAQGNGTILISPLPILI